MWDWVEKNKEWVFSGAGVTALVLLYWIGQRLVQQFRRSGPWVELNYALGGTPGTEPTELLTALSVAFVTFCR